MKQGRIIKGISGFYYVRTLGSDVYECKARGSFRNQGIKPLVGDMVEIEVVSEEDKTGNVMKISPRENALVRPTVANVDQAVMVFAMARPNPNFNMLDKLLVLAGQQEIPAVIVMTKTDLVGPGDIERVRDIYRASEYPLVFCSTETGEGFEDVRSLLSGKTSTVAGPSGAGKSTMINILAPHAQMETGEISKKIKRGKNTTRHCELIAIDDESFIVDTPGFSSLSEDCFVPEREVGNVGFIPVTCESLAGFFPEFLKYSDGCRFRGCTHIHEPGCAVKDALTEGLISDRRYLSYEQIFTELKDNNPY
ncbi:MAG: ribosome small subunit-dependent GTPase A [Clostridiales bacterium]|nr:ribosome small subunit-dependent GTPase A [Clostridiales bacterium]